MAIRYLPDQTINEAEAIYEALTGKAPSDPTGLFFAQVLGWHRAGLIKAAQLADVALCTEVSHDHGLDLADTDAKTARLSLARLLSNHLIQDVLETSAVRIAAAGVMTADDTRCHPDLLIAYSEGTAAKTKALRSFLYAHLYFHPEVSDANQRACDLMADVFGAYLQDPSQIGREATRRVPNSGLHRAAGDYIAGMTDRYLLREHARLFHGA